MKNFKHEIEVQMVYILPRVVHMAENFRCLIIKTSVRKTQCLNSIKSAGYIKDV